MPLFAIHFARPVGFHPALSFYRIQPKILGTAQDNQKCHESSNCNSNGNNKAKGLKPKGATINNGGLHVG